MSGQAVTVVPSGGLAVTHVESGAPALTVVESGGIAVTVVESGGLPFVMEGLAPPTEAPASTALPVISGTPTVGETLTASNGSWSNSPTSNARQWYADAVAIDGATSSSYLLTASEEGASITVGVVATNAVGASAEAVSAAVGPVAAAAGAPTAPVLTLTSAAGTNPPSWSSQYSDVVVGSDYLCCRWRVDGGAWTNETNVLIDSDFVFDYGVDGASYPWPLFSAATFNAGELVEIQEGILRSGTTAWSDTISDTMAASDVTFSYGNKATSATSSTAISFAAATFAGGGRALIFLTGFSSAGGTTDSLPASITITPSAGGAAINCTSLGEGGRAASRAFAIYLSDSDVSAGNYDITGTRPAAARSNVIMWGTLVGASSTPTTAATFTSGSSADPQQTASLTCVASGLIVGAVMIENSATLTANTGTTLHDQIFFNSECGLCLGSRNTTGSVSFNASIGTPNWGKGAVAFGPV